MCPAEKESIVIVPNKCFRATGVARLAMRAARPRLAMIVVAMAAFVVASGAAVARARSVAVALSLVAIFGIAVLALFTLADFT